MMGSCLWLGCDEATTVERLITRDGSRFAEHRGFDLGHIFTLPVGDDEEIDIEGLTHDGGRFAEHRGFDLGRIFTLPAGDDEEIDIEGLTHDGGYLWITGSHSLKRKKPKRHEKDEGEALRRLFRVKSGPNRCFLTRVPLVPAAEGGVHDLARSGIAGATAALLPMASGTNALAEALAADPLLGWFTHIPCKENGLDIEGIAVRGDRVFLCLRGPVLHGWAMIIALEVRSEDTETLALNAIGPQGEPYRLHFLDLGGLGIRDLLLDGDDLVILAGPTMDLDGPSRIHRWPGTLGAGAPAVVAHEQIDHLLDVSYGEGVDQAEGIALIAADGGERRLLVVYDSSAASRLHEGGTAIDADAFVFPSRAPS